MPSGHIVLPCMHSISAKAHTHEQHLPLPSLQPASCVCPPPRLPSTYLPTYLGVTCNTTHKHEMSHAGMQLGRASGIVICPHTKGESPSHRVVGHTALLSAACMKACAHEGKSSAGRKEKCNGTSRHVHGALLGEGLETHCRSQANQHLQRCGHGESHTPTPMLGLPTPPLTSDSLQLLVSAEVPFIARAYRPTGSSAYAPLVPAAS